MLENRQLVAIMFCDIVGYTAMMEKDEVATRKIVERFREVHQNCIPEHGGEVFNYYGDGSLSFFQTASEAVRCALEMQLEFQNEPKVPLRVGIHVGEILIENKEVFGMGVNVASRLESLGKAGAILFSKNVYEKIQNQPELKAVSLGSYHFKNVSHPIEVFGLLHFNLPIPTPDEIGAKLKEIPKKKIWKILSRPTWIAGIAIVLIGLILLLFIKPFHFLDNSAPAGTHRSIAVMPFDNYQSDPAYDYFGDAISDEIRNKLLSVSNLKVISAPRVNTTKG